MSMTKRTLLASGAALTLGATARAQGPSQGSNQMQDALLDHQALYLEPNGHMRIMKLSDTGSAMVKRYGHQMATERAMFYRDAGNNYVLNNQKMPDGGMLFDRMNDWAS